MSMSIPAPSRPPAPTNDPQRLGGEVFGVTVWPSGPECAGLRYQSLTNTAALLAAVWGVREGLLAIPNERAPLGRLSFERSPVALDKG